MHGGFVYVVIAFDAWSRRVVGYGISRSIDVRLTLAVLHVALDGRRLPPGCIHHSDFRSQYAAGRYRELPEAHSLRGSTSRRDNPYDNAHAASLMKTLKVEGVYPVAYATFEDVTTDLPRLIEQVYNRNRVHLGPGCLSPVQLEEQRTRPPVKSAA